MFNLDVIYPIVIKEIKLLFRHKFQLFYEMILPIVKMIPTILLGIYLINETGPEYFEKVSGTNTVITFMSISIVFTIFLDIQEQIGYFLENEMWMGTLEQLWLTPVKKISLIIGWIAFATIKAILYGSLSFITILFFVENKFKFLHNINYILFILIFIF